MEFELDDLRFKQADVLRLVPGLNQGTLQNWVNRPGTREVFGVDQARPHKYAKLLWSARAVVMMRIVLQLRKFDVAPSVGAPLAVDCVKQLESFIDRFREVRDLKTGLYFIDPGRLADYRTMKIMADDNGKLFVRDMPHADDAAQPTEDGLEKAQANRELEAMENVLLWQRLVYITLETDLIFLKALNDITRHVTNLDRQTAPADEGSGSA